MGRKTARRASKGGTSRSTATKPASTAGESLIDFGDEQDGGTTTTPATAGSTSSGSAFDLLSLLDTTAAPPPFAAPPVSNILDSLSIDSGGDTLVPSAGAITGGGHPTLDCSNIMLSPTIALKAGNHARSHATSQTLAEDASLLVSYFKVYRPGEALVVLFLSNKSGARINDVKTEIQLPKHMQAELSGDPMPLVQASTLSVAYIDKQSTAFQTISINKLTDFTLAMP